MFRYYVGGWGGTVLARSLGTSQVPGGSRALPGRGPWGRSPPEAPGNQEFEERKMFLKKQNCFKRIISSSYLLMNFLSLCVCVHHRLNLRLMLNEIMIYQQVKFQPTDDSELEHVTLKYYDCEEVSTCTNNLNSTRLLCMIVLLLPQIRVPHSRGRIVVCIVSRWPMDRYLFLVITN